MTQSQEQGRIPEVKGRQGLKPGREIKPENLSKRGSGRWPSEQSQADRTKAEKQTRQSGREWVEMGRYIYCKADEGDGKQVSRWAGEGHVTGVAGKVLLWGKRECPHVHKKLFHFGFLQF